MTKNNFSQAKQREQKGGILNDELIESYSISKVNEIENVTEWAKQISYWRNNIDVFIEDYLSTDLAPIKLKPFQRVIVREIAQSRIVNIAASRGIGKTWLNAICIIALSILFPENKILILSKNVSQAILTCSYIEQFADNNENIRREIVMPISIQKDRAIVKFKNGSEVKAMALSHDGNSVRGQRAKFVFLDESILISSSVIKAAIMPILQYQRPVIWYFKDKGLKAEDFPSTLVETTSAYSKGVDFFQRFKKTFMDMRKGSKDKFACAISCRTGVRLNMIDELQLNDDRERLGEEVFNMEYDCIFIGNTEGSFYPYDLVAKARTLETVELYQPKQSTARYILSLDVATSDAANSDNAALSIIKFTPRTNGTFYKQLVYIITYKGKSLAELATEVRKMCIRFPSIEKVIIDTLALGEGIVSLLQNSYVDPDTNKEYPPLVPDTIEITNALSIIQEYKGNNERNNRGALALKMFLENSSLSLPIFSADLRGKNKLKQEKSKEYLIEEMGVFANADALLIELGYIKAIVLASGVKYDTDSSLKHKDRYSSLMMACLYLFELEEENKQELLAQKSDSCIAVTVAWK